MTRGIVFLMLVAVVAAAASCLTLCCFRQGGFIGQTDAHAWIHERLGITEIQHKPLDQIEHRFSEEKRRVGEMLRVANDELARAIVEDRSNSPRVEAAMARVQSVQGELQRATLNHIFEMKSALTPEQYEKLIRLTADALSTSEHGR